MWTLNTAREHFVLFMVCEGISERSAVNTVQGLVDTSHFAREISYIRCCRRFSNGRNNKTVTAVKRAHLHSGPDRGSVVVPEFPTARANATRQLPRGTMRRRREFRPTNRVYASSGHDSITNTILRRAPRRSTLD